MGSRFCSTGSKRRRPASFREGMRLARQRQRTLVRCVKGFGLGFQIAADLIAIFWCSRGLPVRDELLDSVGVKSQVVAEFHRWESARLGPLVCCMDGDLKHLRNLFDFQ